jgi:GT2 family glycosyltransferase
MTQISLKPLVTAIVVSYNTAELLSDCLGALFRSAEDFELQTIIIDNASRDESVSILKQNFNNCELIENKVNVGFGRANNQALPLVKGDFVLLLNTDAFVAADTLNKSISYMELHPECGGLGVKLIGRDGDLQPSCRDFPTPLKMFLKRVGLNSIFSSINRVDDFNLHHSAARKCDWVTGCYLLLRKNVIDQIGLFDPRFFLYCEEVDLCLRVKNAGWEIHFLPDTKVVHYGGESAKSDSNISNSGRQISSMQIESEFLYFRKNFGLFYVISHFILQVSLDVLLTIWRKIKGRRSMLMEDSYSRISILINTRFGCRNTR